jgi:CRISPR-associated endonuclease/helicase Cas3
MSSETFKTTFKLLTDHEPFPWQIQLFEEWFANGKFPQSCNLPTGLGKTSVIAIWLIALMDHPDKMPRRLVYVVNRRTVVDQTTDEVEKLGGCAKSLRRCKALASTCNSRSFSATLRLSIESRCRRR